MISLLHPSRQRPEKSRETLNRWIQRARTPIEVIISIDEDDTTRGIYEANAAATGATVLVNKNRSAVDAINRAASTAKGNIFIVVSDDTDCPTSWDEKILSATKGQTDWILKTYDGIQKWIITMPVMDRAYYSRFNYVYYPEYKHMFCDTELSCVADLTCRRISAPILFPHLHYSTGKTTKDQLNERADSTWKQGEELFLSRYQAGFGLSDVKCHISDRSYLKWISNKLKK